MSETSGSADQPPLSRQKIKPGTVRRIFRYVRPYRWPLTFLLSLTALIAAASTSTSLLFAAIIDDGVLPGRVSMVIILAGAILGLAVIQASAMFLENRMSARIGQGIVYDLRSQVFRHIQDQPLAFFTRAQTGSLVSRLNNDVIGAQQAITSLLSQTVSTVLTLAFVLAAMFLLSWQIAIFAIVLIPLFILPGKFIGRRLQRLAREQMQLNAELGSMMNERFNVAGAILVKLYGRKNREAVQFDTRAGWVRDIGIRTSVVGQALGISMMFANSLILALTFGIGGYLVIHHSFKIGVLVALATLIGRFYGPVTQLSNMQTNVLVSLVSFDRVFEVLDLKPLVTERPGASPLSLSVNGSSAAPEIEFDRVSFSYPAAKDVSLPSLESFHVAIPRGAGNGQSQSGRADEGPVSPPPERAGSGQVLVEVSFRAYPGQLTALVGPSGAGKTTITHMVPRFYDPESGTVRINGQDVRDLTLESVQDTVGVVTQDAHMFHDTIRANLLYAQPGASEGELMEACKAGQIWDLIASLPDGLDTVVGDRGYRMSGGEKQRIALARLLLKAPPVVVLDEATAHLDAESEVAVQQALKIALSGRTSLVIAHRLSTIREADQIVVIESGQIRQCGTHDDLLEAGGLYANLYHTQFARRSANGGEKSGRPR
jgi:ATP-binding cassette, subfamily B, bacterial